MHRSFTHSATAALIALFGLAACTGEDLPVEAGSSEAASAALPVAAPATDVPHLIGNTWIVRPAMPTSRSGLVAATVNGIVYAIGGVDVYNVPLGKVEAYNASSPSWSTKASLPAPRSFPNGAGVINGKIYVAGGINPSESATRSLFVYTPGTNTWAS
jgi:N-acetylneuraminic acid mutarotase